MEKQMKKERILAGDLLLEKYDTLWMITEVIKMDGTQEIVVKPVNRDDLELHHSCRYSFYINTIRDGIRTKRFMHYPVKQNEK